MDGESVDNGQLILNPTGEGPKAIGIVTSDGTFRLTAPGSKHGAFPGKYHVLFKHNLELTDKVRKRLERQIAGLDLKELSVSYSSPRKEPLEIPEEGAEELVIDIDSESGWRRIISD